MRFQTYWFWLALLLSTPVFAVDNVRKKVQGEWSRAGHQTRYKISADRLMEHDANNPNKPKQTSVIRYPFGKSYAEAKTQNGTLHIYSGGEDIIAVESFDKQGAFIDDGAIFHRHGKAALISPAQSLQSAEQAYTDVLKGVAEEHERTLADLKDRIPRGGDLSGANQIDEQIDKIKREIERLEQWPKLEKTTWDMWVGGSPAGPEGKAIKRDFWSDGKAFDAAPYEKLKVIPANYIIHWHSFTDENGRTKIQLIPSRGHFVDTYVLTNDGKSLEGINQSGVRVYGKRTGEPVFERRKPVR